MSNNVNPYITDTNPSTNYTNHYQPPNHYVPSPINQSDYQPPVNYIQRKGLMMKKTILHLLQFQMSTIRTYSQ